MRISDWSSDVCSSDLALPGPKELRVQGVAGDLVERPERLVHQEEIGLEAERAGDRDAWLHAARELPGKLLLEAAEVHQLQVARRPVAALRGSEAHDLQRQHDVALDRAPGIERRRLEHVAVGARQSVV